ncbi:MAG: TIGR00341 family protein [Acidobacteriota bacterium]
MARILALKMAMEEIRMSQLSQLLGDFDLLHLTEEDKRAIYEDIRTNNQMRPGYLLLVLTACMIALLGLLINSTAVVIGAMLISPLMNPFLSAALALTLGDWTLGRQALRTIVLSVIVAVIISAFAVSISPLKETTSEILARTQPNLMDLLIAFFAGLAGTYTMVVRKGSTTIPGVAIATAVMPPLCVTGFGLYQGVFYREWFIAGGAFALFLTNLVAIVVSAALVFALAHFRTQDQYGAEKSRYGARFRLAISFSLLILLSIPLLYSLITAVGQTRERHQIEAVLRNELERIPGSRVERGWEMKHEPNGQTLLSVALRTTNYLKPEEVTAVEQALTKTLRRSITLQLSQLRVRAGGVIEPTVSTLSPGLGPAVAITPPPPTPSAHLEGIRNWVEPLIKELEMVFGTKIESYHLEVSAQEIAPILAIRIKSDEPSTTGAVEVAKRIVKQRWAHEGFKASNNEAFLRVNITPKSDPYITVRFEPNRTKILAETRPYLQQFIQYWRANNSLKPILLVPTNQKLSTKLQQKRKQVLLDVLKKEGWQPPILFEEKPTEGLFEDELALRFMEPTF